MPQQVANHALWVSPVFAVPKALKQAGLSLNDIDQIELNEAFAAQALAVVRTLDIDPSKLNPNGGAIALGHALGSTGARLSVQLFNEMRRRNQKYGMVTACVGGGQGVVFMSFCKQVSAFGGGLWKKHVFGY
jgi:acetyl-CoA acyltransferase